MKAIANFIGGPQVSHVTWLTIAISAHLILTGFYIPAAAFFVAGAFIGAICDEILKED